MKFIFQFFFLLLRTYIEPHTFPVPIFSLFFFFPLKTCKSNCCCFTPACPKNTPSDKAISSENESMYIFPSCFWHKYMNILNTKNGATCNGKEWNILENFLNIYIQFILSIFPHPRSMRIWESFFFTILIFWLGNNVFLSWRKVAELILQWKGTCYLTLKNSFMSKQKRGTQRLKHRRQEYLPFI